MKKKFLFFVMVCIAVLCSACTRQEFDDFIMGRTKDRSPDSIEIDVIVGGVDGGILNGARVCEWGEQYAYYDDGILYYYEDKASEAKTIQVAQPSQMAMTEDYIYYCYGNSLVGIDLKTMEQHNVNGFYSDDYITGINIYSDEVLAVTDDLHVYDVSGLEASNVDGLLHYGDFLSVKNHCANMYGDLNSFIFLDEKNFKFDGDGFSVEEGSNVEKKIIWMIK